MDLATSDRRLLCLYGARLSRSAKRPRNNDPETVLSPSPLHPSIGLPNTPFFFLFSNTDWSKGPTVKSFQTIFVLCRSTLPQKEVSGATRRSSRRPESYWSVTIAAIAIVRSLFVIASFQSGVSLTRVLLVTSVSGGINRIQ